MGFFGGRSKGDCEDKGGHDQRMHTRQEPDGKKSTVVDCNGCGMEYKYDEDGRRK